MSPVMQGSLGHPSPGADDWTAQGAKQHHDLEAVRQAQVITALAAATLLNAASSPGVS